MCDQISAYILLLLAGRGQDRGQALRRGCGQSPEEMGRACLWHRAPGKGKEVQPQGWRLGAEGLPGPVEVTRAQWCHYLNRGTRGRYGCGCWGSPGSDVNELRTGHCEPVEAQGALVRRQPEWWASRGPSLSPGLVPCREGHQSVTHPGHSSRALSWRVTLLQGRSLSENWSFPFPPNLHAPLRPASRCPFG